ncbi:hypothetical protein [Nocardiopsis ansamitocini]|uniref:Uncharacterized protein n=1 Tax=Nocardiopsis ansamitocini TaxID=1670832 RepID=A0A9W6UJ68_9ACTN|nr:hypothetical protein [Nocardiopsis ansamitocini]GLU48514.1 hypothetical protein Nans01_28650 [Nocardiopsis ansamitocini]
MIDPFPQHPYRRGTRVHGAAERASRTFATGTASVVDAWHAGGGSYTYLVRTDDGAQEYWSSPMTIPAGTWIGKNGDETLEEPALAGASAGEETAA